MAAGPKRRIRVRPVKGFKAIYRAFVKQVPAIKRTMRVFNEVKRKIPPESLPRGMKDHQLKGKWKAYRECHLAPNVLLIYKQDGDNVTLVDVLNHDALK